MKPVETWRDAIRQKREADEQLWAELNQAVHMMLTQKLAGHLVEAQDSARAALDIEHSLTGDCDATAALCDALGLETDPVDSDEE